MEEKCDLLQVIKLEYSVLGCLCSVEANILHTSGLMTFLLLSQLFFFIRVHFKNNGSESDLFQLLSAVSGF